MRWIIQNSYTGNLNIALAIALNWHNTYTNTGANTPPLTDDSTLPSYYIYVISQSQQLVAVEDRTNKSDKIFLRVVRYPYDLYAALLPIEDVPTLADLE